MSVKRPYQRLSRDAIYNILSVYPFLLVRRKGLNRKKSLIMLFINLTNSIDLQNKDTPFSLNLSFICIKNYCLFKRFLIQILYHGFAKIAYPKKGLPSVYLKLHFFLFIYFIMVSTYGKNFYFSSSHLYSLRGTRRRYTQFRALFKKYMINFTQYFIF